MQLVVMLIENIEKKIRLVVFTAILALLGGVILGALGLYAGHQALAKAQENIYVLSNDVPLIAHKAEGSHLDIEGRAVVKNFHKLFFTLPPDDRYIEETISQALYLTDESGVRQRNALTERGFYNYILAQSANFAIVCDSLSINPQDNSFVYYGTQRIEGRTAITYRSLETTGRLVPIPRTENNPYGLLIVDYKTIANKDIETKNLVPR